MRADREKPVRILKVTIEKKREEPFVNATLDEMRKTVTLKTTLGNIRIKWSRIGRPTTCATS